MAEYTNIDDKGLLVCPFCGAKNITSLKTHIRWDCHPKPTYAKEHSVAISSRLTAEEIETFRTEHPEIAWIVEQKSPAPKPVIVLEKRLPEAVLHEIDAELKAKHPVKSEYKPMRNIRAEVDEMFDSISKTTWKTKSSKKLYSQEQLHEMVEQYRAGKTMDVIAVNFNTSETAIHYLLVDAMSVEERKEVEKKNKSRARKKYRKVKHARNS